MVDQIIRPSALPNRPSPVSSEKVPVDNGVIVGGATIQALVEAGRPSATQAEAVAGVDAVKAMTPLTTKQAIDGQVPVIVNSSIDALDLGTASQSAVGDFATAAQGVTADTAVQPADLAEVATTGDYNDLINQPVIPPGLIDGDKRDILVSSSGTIWQISRDFKTVSELISDSTRIGYSGSGAEVTVNVGYIITAQGFRYEVAASAASDNHLVTAGGVKLYARPDTENRISTSQFGIPNGVESAPVQAAFLALVQACREQVAVVFQPEGSDIWLNATADVRNVHIDMRGRLFRNHATQPVIISGGNSNVRNNPPQKFWTVENLGGADNPAIIVKGMKGSVMDLQRCNSVLLYADTTLALAGADDSIAYSVFNFYDVTQIELGNNPTTDGSAIQWINENRFNLKRTGRIYIGRNSTYRHNHNTFVNGNVEGETAAIIIVDMGQDNQFTDLRFEGTPVITLTANSRSTTIEYSWNDNSDLLRDPSRLWRNALINDQGTGNRVIYMPWKTDTRSVVFSFNARQHRTFSLGVTAYGGGSEHKMITAYPVGFETVARGSGSTILDWTPLIPFPLNSRFVMGCDAATVRPNVRFYTSTRTLITTEPTQYLPSQAVQWNTDHIRPTSTNLSNFGVQNQDPNIAFISIRVQGGSAVLPFSVLYCHLWNRAPDTLDIISRYQIDRIGEASRPNAGVPTRGVPYVGQVVRAPDGTTNRCAYQTSTETTAATTTTATTITVPTGHGATAGNNIAIELTDGSVHWTTVTSAATNVITIPALPGVAAPLGANVQIWSWV